MLKVVVLQKTSLSTTEEIVLEELQVFKVLFAAPLAREGGSGACLGWGHTWAQGCHHTVGRWEVSELQGQSMAGTFLCPVRALEKLHESGISW